VGERARRDPSEVRGQQRVRRTRHDIRQLGRHASTVLRGAAGTLIKGLGADHVVWGTDSVWYGSPQWQIEALRRIEIPEDMQKKYGFTPLGAADGMVKSAIFGYNSARLYGLSLRAEHKPLPAHYQDKLARLRAEYELAGLARSNAAYGFIRKRA